LKLKRNRRAARRKRESIRSEYRAFGYRALVYTNALVVFEIYRSLERESHSAKTRAALRRPSRARPERGLEVSDLKTWYKPSGPTWSVVGDGTFIIILTWQPELCAEGLQRALNTVRKLEAVPTLSKWQEFRFP